MSRAYGSPFLYEHRMGEGEETDHGLLDGALFVRLSRASVPSILIEAGGGLPPSADTVRRGVSGVENVLRELGSIPGEVRSSPDPRVLRGFRIVTPARGGLLEAAVALGEEVVVDQVLARMTDAHGGLIEEIRAPAAGVVLTVPLNPAIGTGSWAYEIGW